MHLSFVHLHLSVPLLGINGPSTVTEPVQDHNSLSRPFPVLARLMHVAKLKRGTGRCVCNEL